jgi:hypothetical protein
MGDVTINGDKRMTTAEVSEALGVSDRTVRRHAEKMGITRNGKVTNITETQATAIKLAIEHSGRNDLDNVGQLPSTDLEMMLWDKKINEWKDRKIWELQARIDRLTHDNRTFTTSQIAKEIGMKSAQELNQALLTKGISYKDTRGVWLLHSQYAGHGFQRIKDKELEGKIVYYAEWTGIGRDWLLGIFK